jgi:hypothetical protein
MHTSLSAGKRAGIGLGVAVGILSIIIIVVCLVFGARRRSETSEKQNAGFSEPEIPELSAGARDMVKTNEEIRSENLMEVKTATILELEGKPLHSPAELPSS